MKVAEGPLQNGLITVENRLTVFWSLIRLPNLLAVKQYIGCRRNVVGAMGKGRISERSERETIAPFLPLLREVKPAFHRKAETPVSSPR